MDELRFRIRGVKRETTDRWRQQARAGPYHSDPGTSLAQKWKSLHRSTRLLLILGTGLYIAYAVAPAGSVSLQDVQGERVLLLLDTSGSMLDTTERTSQQLATLQAHNVSVTSPVSTNGYAISAAKTEYSMLQPLQAALDTNTTVTVVYFISDFKGGDNEDNDADGYAQLKELVRTHRLTLYFCTVDQPPPPNYYQITRATGGGVIEEFEKKQ